MSTVYFLLQVFRPRTSSEAMDLVGQLLEYTPTRRLAPLDACVHAYFDELRQPVTRLPNGKPLPPMFNFSAAGMLLLAFMFLCQMWFMQALYIFILYGQELVKF